MAIKSLAVSILMLSAAIWAQSGSTGEITAAEGGPPSSLRPVAVKGAASEAENRFGSVQTAARVHTQDMQDTLSKMRGLLKQMHTKAALNSVDPLIKANLEMWELMLSHLDRQLAEMKVATITREDLEARRAAQYTQAMARASIAGRGARGMSASQALAAGKVANQVVGATSTQNATNTAEPDAPSSPNELDKNSNPVPPSPK